MSEPSHDAAPPSAPVGDGRFRLRESDLSWRRVDGEVVVLDERTWEYVHLNGSAALLWAALTGRGATLSSLAAQLVEAYPVAQPSAADDVERFVAELRDRQLLAGA